MKKFLERHTIEIVIAAALTVAALVILFTGTPAAADQQANKITVSSAWSRPSVGDQATGVIYLTINNPTATADKLISVQTVVSKEAMLHETTNEGGVMRMRHVHGGIEIAPNTSLKLAPASYHIMLMGLKAPLTRGQTFLAELSFEKAGNMEIPVTVNIMAPEQAEERGSHNR